MTSNTIASISEVDAKKWIPVAAPVLGPKAQEYVNDCLTSTWISSAGRYIDEFERRFAAFCGTKHAIACNNGTTALHLALVVLGIGPGDEVIVPDLTYVATANCVRYCGATPVFVDNDVATYNIDPGAIRAKITPRTKAILVVHLYGHSCDMDPVLEIAREHSLLVVEDAAEAHGAKYKGRMVGSFGDCATFSFFGNKIITTGEGGAVVTNDDQIAAQLRLFRGQGMSPERRYWFEVIGYNYRMTNVAAAIGVAQMERVETALAFRKNLAELYAQALQDVPGVILPHVANWAEHSYWMYTIMLDPSVKVSRDEIMVALHKRGIETRPVFYPMHVLPPYKQDGVEFPRASLCAERGINLPTHELLEPADVSRIANALAEILAGSGAV